MPSIISQNATLYGRYYDSIAEEIGYTFTLGVDVIDDIKPEITITDEQIASKTIQVTVNANDNETGMTKFLFKRLRGMKWKCGLSRGRMSS